MPATGHGSVEPPSFDETLSIWSHDNSQPDDEVAGGDFVIRSNKSWHRADLEEPAPLDDNERFWVVWDAPVNAQANLAQSGTQMTYMFSTNNGVTWQEDGTQHRVMMRIECCD